jgi:hypothetical protein
MCDLAFVNLLRERVRHQEAEDHRSVAFGKSSRQRSSAERTLGCGDMGTDMAHHDTGTPCPSRAQRRRADREKCLC